MTVMDECEWCDAEIDPGQRWCGEACYREQMLEERQLSRGVF